MTGDKPRNESKHWNLSSQERLARISRILVKAIYLYESDREEHCRKSPGNVSASTPTHHSGADRE